jgi:hypothetical protein
MGLFRSVNLKTLRQRQKEEIYRVRLEICEGSAANFIIVQPAEAFMYYTKRRSRKKCLISTRNRAYCSFQKVGAVICGQLPELLFF